MKELPADLTPGTQGAMRGTRDADGSWKLEQLTPEDVAEQLEFDRKTKAAETGRPRELGKVIGMYAISMQVCVPASWTDDEVVAFANYNNPSGLPAGWSIRRDGDKVLAGSPERVVCSNNPQRVHIMLDC